MTTFVLVVTFMLLSQYHYGSSYLSGTFRKTVIFKSPMFVSMPYLQCISSIPKKVTVNATATTNTLQDVTVDADATEIFLARCIVEIRIKDNNMVGKQANITISWRAFFTETQSLTVGKTIVCQDLYRNGLTSGIYKGKINGTNQTLYCDMEKHGGGWTVIQRRVISDNIDFYRSWEEYRVGFGNRSLSFWIGLDNMYSITNTANYELNIEYMECYENTTKEARYPSFKVGPATNYTLAISDRINTNEEDGLKECNGMAFSTHDADKDSRPFVKCAIKRGSAWWFDVCVKIANLNGKLDRCNESTLKSVSWYGNHGNVVGITFVEMKIRRKS